MNGMGDRDSLPDDLFAEKKTPLFYSPLKGRPGTITRRPGLGRWGRDGNPVFIKRTGI